MSPIAGGLVHMELNRGDGSLGTFLGSSRAGDALDRDARLRGAAAAVAARHGPGGEIGAFALTEPDHGSDSVALETRRAATATIGHQRRQALDRQRLHRRRGRASGRATTADGKVKGFLVETGTPGLHGTPIDGKASLRAVWQADIDAGRRARPGREPAARRATASRTRRRARRHPQQRRLGGARPRRGRLRQRDGLRRERVQFGKPLVSFQIVQDRLVTMLAEVMRACSSTACGSAGSWRRAGSRTRSRRSRRCNNTRKARQVIAEARDLLGGNGILLDYHVMRHMADMEAIHTYEGTETIQTLIVGRDITGVGAFA